ncbi:MAG: circadian clock KaiB family protein [Anaerolineae bacterium]
MSDAEPPAVPSEDVWTFRLYVAGQTPRSVVASANLRKLCDTHLAGEVYVIQIVDLIDNPQLAERDQIIVIPTLVRLSPPPVRRVYGDLSNIEKVLSGLQVPN